MHFLKLFLFFILIYTNRPLQAEITEPYIIYLKGTCSSGKSTLIRSLLREQNDLEIVDEDAIMHQSYVKAVALRYPDEFESITHAISDENLYHALREKDIFFKKTATDSECEKAQTALCMIQEELNRTENLSWKKQVSHEIDLKVLRLINCALELKKSIILDSWYITPKDLTLHFPKTKVVRALLYCSLENSYERLIKRNQEVLIHENLLEKRYLRQLLGSFFSLYQISTHPTYPIHEIKKEELNPLLESISKSLKEQDMPFQKPNFTFEEIPLNLFLKMNFLFLQPFEGAVSPFYISAKDEYEIIIDNSANDIEHAVQVLLKQLLAIVD